MKKEPVYTKLILFLLFFQSIGHFTFAAEPNIYKEQNASNTTSMEFSKRTTADTISQEDKLFLIQAFEKYFVAGENTIKKQVNLSPCQITIIETYNYYGNPHIRLWTYNTELVNIDHAFGDKLRINLQPYSKSSVYDSRIKSQEKLYEINLEGITEDSIEFRHKLERIWHQYQKTCNEPPAAY